MVRRIFTRLTAPVRGLHQAAYLLAGLTLASQVLALLRDRLFASRFGAGEVLDLYYAAFKLPDLVYALVVSLVSAYVLIPRIAGYLEDDQRERARELIAQCATFLFIGAGVISLVAAIFAPALLGLLFPAFTDSAAFSEFVLLARLLLIQPILLGISGILGSVAQLNRRFFIFALSPVLYNLGIIFGVLFYDVFGLPGIGIGVLVGAIAHLVVNIPVVIRAGLMPRFVMPRASVIGPMVRDSVPRSLALSVGSLTLLLLLVIAARVGEGSVAVLTFATNLALVPLSLIGAAYATAAFPVLAEQAGKHNEAFRATLTTAARHIIFWSSVITVLAIVLRAHIVRILLGAGAFDWDDTRLTAAVLAILVVALLAQGSILLASRAFYAAGRSWNPFLVQVGGLVLSVGAAISFLHLAETYPLFRYFIEAALRVTDVPGTEVLFIALGATVGQLGMGALALLTLRSVAPGVAGSLDRPLFDGIAAAILGGAAAYGTLAAMGTIAPLTTLPLVFAQGLLAGIVGLIVAGLVLALLENQEFHDLIASLRKLTSTSALKPYGLANDRPNT